MKSCYVSDILAFAPLCKEKLTTLKGGEAVERGGTPVQILSKITNLNSVVRINLTIEKL